MKAVDKVYRFAYGNEERGPPPERTVFHLLIPSQASGLIIGRDGENVKAIAKSTGTSVRLTDQRSVPVDLRERPVAIEGPFQSCLDAAQDIVNRLLTDPEGREYDHLTTNYNRYAEAPMPYGMNKRRRTDYRSLDSMYGRYDDPYARPVPRYGGPHEEQFNRFQSRRRDYEAGGPPPSRYNDDMPRDYPPRMPYPGDSHGGPPSRGPPPRGGPAPPPGQMEEKVEIDDDLAGALVSKRMQFVVV